MAKQTKEDAQKALDALSEIMDILPKSKLAESFGALNVVSLFLEQAKREARNESK